MSYDKTLWVRELVHGVLRVRLISHNDPEYPQYESTLGCGGYVYSSADDKAEMVTCVRCIVVEREWIPAPGGA